MFPPVLDALALYRDEVGEAPFDFAVLEEYVHALWLAAFAVLLGGGRANAALNRVHQLAAGTQDDGLFIYLVHGSATAGAVSGPLSHERPYAPLLQAALGPLADAPALIGRFLDHYYASMKTAYWHDRHPRPTAGYFGYWAFELAAIVRLHGISDDAFANNPYYPRALTR